MTKNQFINVCHKWHEMFVNNRKGKNRFKEPFFNKGHQIQFLLCAYSF